MSKLVLDPDLRKRLNGLNEPVELIDTSGRTVGHVLPEERYQKLLYAAAEAACPFTSTEIERRRQEKSGRPLAEILKDLERK